MSRAGFTLVELLLVAFLFLLAAAVSVPVFRRTVEAYALDDGGMSLVRTMEFARERAIMTGRPCRVVLELGRGAFRVECLDDRRPAEFSAFPWEMLPRGVAFRADVPPEIEFPPNGARRSARIGLRSESGRSLNIYVDEFRGIVSDEGRGQGT